MEQQGIGLVLALAEKKLRFAKSRGPYTVYAMLAGAYCALGMALAYSGGAAVRDTPGISGLYKLVIGFLFTLAFTLIMFSGAELFTGNVMVMTVGLLEKRVRPGGAAGLLCHCYFANLIGAAVMGGVVALTGLLDGSQLGGLMAESSAAKMALAFWPAFFRGVLCNTLICLGTWMFLKLQSEVAKMIALFWAIIGFVTPGYEHSIANSALFAMALLAPQRPDGVTLAGAVNNLVPVTLGNIAGGALFVGLAYWYSGREKTRPV